MPPGSASPSSRTATFIQARQILEHVAKTVVCLGRLRVLLHCDLKACRCFLHAPQAFQCVAKIVVGIGVFRLDGQRHGDQVHGLLVVAALMGDHSKHMQHHRVIGIRLQYAAIDGLRLGQASGRMMRQRLVQGVGRACQFAVKCRSRLLRARESER